MKKVAIVGVEGSGKTVMLAGLGDLYTYPDEEGWFLAPKNFATAAYVNDKIARMRQGEWPSATTGDETMGLDWTLKRRDTASRRPPEAVCELSFLDFPGEVYRAAYGITEASPLLVDQVDALKRYVSEADELLVLINLSDIIANGIREPRVQEAMWVTRSILDTALGGASGKQAPRAAIVLSQADSYAETIKACGGAEGVLRKYLPYVANDYYYLEVFAANAVDRTLLDDDGNTVPASDFTTKGLLPIIEWIRSGAASKEVRGEESQSAEGGPSTSRGGFFPGGPKADRAKPIDADKMLALGESYYNGEGRTRNYEEAAKCFRKAAEQGLADAQYNLGVCYDNGKGVDEDDAEAVKWYRKAAEQGHAAAQFNLGFCFANGQGVQKDEAEAVKWYRKAAEQGDADAQNNLGSRYYNGEGVAQDYAEAVKWYRKAAEQGRAVAQYNLGNRYYNGEGVAQDYAEAVKWHRKAAEQGHVSAQYNLGVCFANGQGVQKDEAEAVKWYRKAAEQGDGAAQNALRRRGLTW